MCFEHLFGSTVLASSLFEVPVPASIDEMMLTGHGLQERQRTALSLLFLFMHMSQQRMIILFYQGSFKRDCRCYGVSWTLDAASGENLLHHMLDSSMESQQGCLQESVADYAPRYLR